MFTGSYESSHAGGGNWTLVPLEKQYTLLTAEPSLQPWVTSLPIKYYQNLFCLVSAGL